MGDFPTWLVIGLVAGISAMIFGGKNKQTNKQNLGTNKKAQNNQGVVVFCPYCGAEIGLEKVRNYICSSCNNTVAYYETYENITPCKDLANYTCATCGTLNFENVKYCLGCGQEYGPTKRY